MKPFKISLQSSCCWLILVMFVTFISHYAIPPLADFQGHVALGMIDSPFLSHYYHYEFSIVYHLFDSIVRFWTFCLGNDYVHVSLACYLTLIFLLFLPVYTFLVLQNNGHKRVFFQISLLAAPLFLLLHCGGFTWGVIPFNLAVFMATGSSIFLWQIHQEIRTTKTCSYKTTFIFCFYTFLAIFSHAAGFLYLGIAWIIPLTHIISTKQYGKKRFLFLIVLIVILAILSLFINKPFFKPFGNFASWLKNESTRLYWIISGNPYNLYHLIPHAQTGWFNHQFFRQLLTCVPYTMLACLIYCRKEKNNWRLFLISQLTLQLILEIFIVDSFGNDVGNLTYLHSRNWLFIDAWTFISLAYLITQLKEGILKKLCYVSPLLMAFCLYAIMPLYANFRGNPIEKRADHYTTLLVIAAEDYRGKHPESADKPIVITYNYHPIDSNWFLYHLIPTLMINSPILAKHNIVIQAHWCHLYFPAEKWIGPGPRSGKVIYLQWQSETKNIIYLAPLPNSYK